MARYRICNISPIVIVITLLVVIVTPATLQPTLAIANNNSDTPEALPTYTITYVPSNRSTSIGVDKTDVTLREIFSTADSDMAYMALNQNLISTNTTIGNNTLDLFIISAVDGNGNQLTNNGTTSSRSVTFHFEEREPGIGFFACAVDNQSRTTCDSPITLSNLTLGSHLFKIQPYFSDFSILPNGTQIVSAYPLSAETFYWRILPAEQNRP